MKGVLIKRILACVLGVLFLGILVLACVYLFLCWKDPNPDRKAQIENDTGFVQTYGRNLYDEQGDLLVLRGVNLGNWFVQEDWMAVSSVGEYETGVYTQTRGLRAMQDNPNLTDEQIESLNDLYLDTYITERDFEIIASLELNCVRVNFSYLTLTTDGKTYRENAFEKLDWVLEQCEENGLYAILDLHGAIGSQNQDQHSGNDAEFDLYGNREHMDMTVALWKTVAARYRDRSVVAAYDLLNETRSAPGDFTGKVQFDFYDELYQAIRTVDAHHVMIMECFTFPIHGVSEKEYDWENICYSYHIYNLAPFSQKTCLYFYKALHNLKNYDVPVYIGEWCAWGNEEDWTITMDFFEELGWSYSSWTYKTNAHYYWQRTTRQRVNWGIYELDMEAVDLSTATYEEIAAVWGAVSTENAKQTVVYDIYKAYFADKTK